VLNKDQLPFTTDLVFGTEGYDITYILEDTNFVPTSLTPRDQDPMDRDGNDANKGKPVEKDPENVLKKFKNTQGASGSKSATRTENNGPTPMQAQLAVLPTGIQRLRSLMQPLQWEDLAKLPPVAMTAIAATTLPSPNGTPGSNRNSNTCKKNLPASTSDLIRSTSGTKAVVDIPLSATPPMPDGKMGCSLARTAETVPTITRHSTART